MWISGYEITNLQGLSVLTTIGKNFSLCYKHPPDLPGDGYWYSGNPLLTSLDGLNNLNSIGGDFEVISNKSLVDFSGLENLDSIQGNLIIGHHPSECENNGIVSLVGLDNLDYIGGNLSIVYNDSLSNCEALSICNYLSNPNGTVEIHHNATGCDNPAEIAEGCGITLPCLPYGNYYFFSQEEIDGFQTDYPDCYDLSGDVFIEGDDISNLNGLNMVTSIDGNLVIGDYYSNNPLLSNLQGLENLTYVGGNLSISLNNSLISLVGLESLTSIGGGFFIANNDTLISLESLESLTSIGEGFFIGNNDMLTSLVGLENLSSVGGTLSITYNDTLTSLTALENINTIGGNLRIYSNPLLSNCEAEGICAYLSDPNGYIEFWGNADGCSSMFEVAVACGTTIPCLEDQTIYFHSQFDVDHFPVVFPGCTEIMTSIFVKGDDIENLDSLNVITSIDGNLSFSDNTDLTSLIGLENLTSIGGALKIYRNNNLVTLSGLDNLSTVGGDFYLGRYVGNLILASLTGLENLTSIGGDFVIENNDTLLSMTGLENLSTVGGNFTIEYNDALASLTGLENLTSIGVSFMINNNDSLTSLTDLENLTSIGRDLFIFGSSALTSLSGLENLTTIGRDLILSANNKLTTLTGLEDLITIGGGLFVEDNNVLISLAGLENLTYIGGNLFIGMNWGNNKLTSLTGLDNLSSIGGTLYISDNDKLTSITSLESLSSVGGDLWIHSNPLLSNCEAEGICSYLSDPSGEIHIYGNDEGCSSIIQLAVACGGPTLPCPQEGIVILSNQFEVDHFSLVFAGCSELGCSIGINGADIDNLDSLSFITSIGGYLKLNGNDALTSLEGLGNLTTVGEYLMIEKNDALITTTGLESLSSIGGYLELVDNNSLLSISGLKNLTAIGGYLLLRNNDALTSLAGLENIEAESIMELGILENNQLTECEVQSICDFLASPNGFVLIDQNAPGCNSQQEVQEACWIVHIEEGQTTEDQYNFYPNPVTASAKLSGEFSSGGTVNICIFNTIGLCIKSWEFASQQTGQQEFTLNLNELQPGIYFLRMQVGNEVMTKKVVKL